MGVAISGASPGQPVQGSRGDLHHQAVTIRRHIGEVGAWSKRELSPKESPAHKVASLEAAPCRGYLEALRVLSERDLRNAVSEEISLSVNSLPNCM